MEAATRVTGRSPFPHAEQIPCLSDYFLENTWDLCVEKLSQFLGITNEKQFRTAPITPGVCVKTTLFFLRKKNNARQIAVISNVGSLSQKTRSLPLHLMPHGSVFVSCVFLFVAYDHFSYHRHAGASSVQYRYRWHSISQFYRKIS